MAASSGQNSAGAAGKIGQTNTQSIDPNAGGVLPARGGVKKVNPDDPYQGDTGAQQLDDLETLREVFRGLQQNAPIPHGVKRPIIRRGYSGAVLNPDGSDPGSGFSQFERNNPHLATQQMRQDAVNNEYQQRLQQRDAMGANAVEFAKQTKGYTDAGGNFVKPTLPDDSLFKPIGGGATSVTGTDGYKSVFDKSGRAVGTNMPMAGPQDEDMWDISRTNPRNPNLGQAISNATDDVMGLLRGGVPGAQNAFGGAQNSDPTYKSIFQSDAQKAIGNSELAKIEARSRPKPQVYSDGKTLGQREVERRKGMNSTGYSDEQLNAMSKLFKPGRKEPMSNIMFDMSNLYPGDDFGYLNQIFPGGMDYNGLMKALQDPGVKNQVLSRVGPAPKPFQWIQ